MPISHTRRMVFVHVPKNAGTAITLAKGMEFQMEGHHKWTEYQSCLGKEKWEEYFKFSVIRNAWDRLYSSYKYARMPKSYWHSNDCKRSTEHLWHFCERSGGSGCYATSLSRIWRAAGRVLTQLTGRSAARSSAESSSGAGMCMSFSKTHSK